MSYVLYTIALRCFHSPLSPDSSFPHVFDLRLNQVRRAAMHVLVCLIRGLGEDALTVLSGYVRELADTCRHVEDNDSDPVTRYRSVQTAPHLMPYMAASMCNCDSNSQTDNINVDT